MVRKPPAETTYSLDDLERLSGLSRRTVRYYIQIGLIERAEGATKAARYSARHLERLLQIRGWTDAGLNLDRISQLLSGEIPAGSQNCAIVPGGVEVRSHIVVADGLEVSVEASRAGLGPEAMRKFVKLVAKAYQAAREEEDELRVRDTPDRKRRDNDS